MDRMNTDTYIPECTKTCTPGCIPKRVADTAFGRILADSSDRWNDLSLYASLGALTCGVTVIADFFCIRKVEVQQPEPTGGDYGTFPKLTEADLALL